MPRPSPIAKADVRLCGCEDGKWWIDVRFQNKEALDQLIAVLNELRDTPDIDHAHLQAKGLSPQSELGQTEVIFYKPGQEADEISQSLAKSAKRILTSISDV